MNGPNPVCTSARKKMNQSRPRKLWREGAAEVRSITDSEIRGRAASLLTVGAWPHRGGGQCKGMNLRVALICSRLLAIKLQRLQTTRRAEHNDRLVLLVFGCRGHLLLGQFQRDAVTLVRDAPEMQRAPIDDDLPNANPEKSPEIDDSRAHCSRTIDDHVDDASHVLIRGAADLAPQHAVRLFWPDDSDYRRRCRLLWGGWRSGVVLRPRCARHHRGERGNEDAQMYSPHKASCTNTGSVREHDRYLDTATRLQDLQRHLIAMTPDPKIDAGRAQPQFPQDDLVQERRQARVAKPYFSPRRIEFQSKRRLQKRERRGACPGVRRTCPRVERGTPTLFATESAEQFRKPP